MADLLQSLGGLPRLHFSLERSKQLEASSDDLVDDAVHMYDQFHARKLHRQTSEHWRLVKQRKSLNVYRERGKAKCRDSRKYLCSGVMPGTVEDMVSGTYFDTTENMRIGLSVLMDKFLDARVLHVFETNDVSSSIIFSGVKWLALKTPTSAALIHDRDLLFYNRIGRIVDRHGRYFVYCVMRSIDLDEFPATCHQKLERSFISLCYLFRQVHEEWVGCFIIGSSSMGGTLPRSLSEHITAERMLSVGNFLIVARAKAYSARVARSADRLPSTSSSCDVCMKKATLLTGSFKLCMGCRRNTCRKCREWCTVFQLELRTHKPSKERFCSQCISDVTRPTVSTFYTCSLNESTSRMTDNQRTGSVSTSQSGIKLNASHGSSSSPSSREISEEESDGWHPGPCQLDGLAHFVERASGASARDAQWNQDELDYFSDMLRESGYGRGHDSSSQATATTSHTRRCTQHFQPSSSLPPRRHEREDHSAARTCASEDYSGHPRTVFSVDELD